MTQHQINRLAEIQTEMESVRLELITWDMQGDRRYPLSLAECRRLEHTPAAAFLAFREACTSGLKKRLEELHAELAAL